VRELLGGEDPEDVRLVLGLVARGAARAVGSVDERRVVSRAHGVEAEFDGALEERCELDLLVAAHARFGVRPAWYSATKSSMTSARNARRSPT
jgi:hypothetical protein